MKFSQRSSLLSWHDCGSFEIFIFNLIVKMLKWLCYLKYFIEMAFKLYNGLSLENVI